MSRVPRNQNEARVAAVDRERMALHRADVRQLADTLRRQVGSALGQFAFEPNDESTRRAIRASVGQTLERSQLSGALQDFAVVCDETNNTPEDIDQGRLNCSILVRPMRAAETMVINVAIDPSQHREAWGEPEIVVHEKEVVPVLVKYFRKLNIPED